MVKIQKLEGNIEAESNIWLKIRFYILSLFLLFVLILVLTIDVPLSFDPKVKVIGFQAPLLQKILSIISILVITLCFILTQKTEYEWKGTKNPVYQIKSIKNENYEYLTFLSTYVIPLICIDLTKIRYVIVLFTLLCIIGFIFIKMDLYYGNPTLALLGYKLYRVEIDDVDTPESIILITRDPLYEGDYIRWIEIDENVWIAKENKK